MLKKALRRKLTFNRLDESKCVVRKQHINGIMIISIRFVFRCKRLKASWERARKRKKETDRKKNTFAITKGIRWIKECLYKRRTHARSAPFKTLMIIIINANRLIYFQLLVCSVMFCIRMLIIFHFCMLFSANKYYTGKLIQNIKKKPTKQINHRAFWN